MSGQAGESLRSFLCTFHFFLVVSQPTSCVPAVLAAFAASTDGERAEQHRQARLEEKHVEEERSLHPQQNLQIHQRTQGGTAPERQL